MRVGRATIKYAMHGEGRLDADYLKVHLHLTTTLNLVIEQVAALLIVHGIVNTERKASTWAHLADSLREL